MHIKDNIYDFIEWCWENQSVLVCFILARLLSSIWIQHLGTMGTILQQSFMVIAANAVAKFIGGYQIGWNPEV